MRVLITGAFGFAGRHLIRELLRANHEVAALDLAAPPNEFSDITAYTGDIQDPALCEMVVADARPDACVHLSAITFVPDAWLDIRNVFSINLVGTINVLEAFRNAASGSRILLASSAEVYGSSPKSYPLTECAPLNPGNPYAVSKAAADLTTLLYARRHGMQTITARPANHIGPGQSSNFVAPSLARQVSAITEGKAPPTIRVGNLQSKRDFTDVRDVARAYRLLLERGRTAQAYNIASGATMTIHRLLDELCAIAGVELETRIDPDLFRPAEEPPALDISRIVGDVGWEPRIPLATTLRDIMTDSEQTTGREPDWSN